MSAAAQSIVFELRELGVELRAVGGQVQARPLGRLTPELRERLRTRRDELVALLAATQVAPGSVDQPSTLRSQAIPDGIEETPSFVAKRGPHDPPVRGCWACGSREFVRVRGGPMWICPQCHPPQFESDVIERCTAPEPSRWEGCRA